MKRNRQEVFMEILTVFNENNVNTDALSFDVRLDAPDFPIDSVLFMKLLVDLENRFQIELNYPEALGAEKPTLGSLTDYIEGCLARKTQ
ncbi:acyl carrier protein [Brevibacillus fulvus]|uniref:Acyl carrier protein n=1 Tax=Brevibacillus fulvus TaxID=1125967 RepID=A0A939BTN0_9BACL|nr:phosphopantetheine-binding protein [Brevibacillus fulvus]MBM7589639.1 acyl carrier protein [Brevibacillus fulvus]